LSNEFVQTLLCGTVFLARGPAFAEGVVLPPFDNVDLYPLLARLVGIRPAPNDGDAQALVPARRPEAAGTGAAGRPPDLTSAPGRFTNVTSPGSAPAAALNVFRKGS
jgi:hypothetical protein